MNPFDTSNVYTPTTYEEVKEAKQKAEEAVKDSNRKYKDYLITCLCTTGLVNVIVRVKESDTRGILIVEENNSSALYPYEVKFYPIRKDGGVSLKSKYVAGFWGWIIKDLLKMLTDTFESTGEKYES